MTEESFGTRRPLRREERASKYPGQTQSRSGLWSMLVHLVRGVLPDWYEPNGDEGASLDENAVDNAVLTRTGSDLDSTLVGFDDCALDEDVSSDVVGVGFVLDHIVYDSEGGLACLWIVD